MEDKIPYESNGHDAPTPAAEWRKARVEGYLKLLPSGNYARLRPVTPDLLITTGDIPDTLTPIVVKMLFEGAGDEEMQDMMDPKRLLETAGDTVRLFNTVCRLAFVSPRIVDDPQGDDEISIEDIDLADRGLVFQICTQPAEVLRRFRLEPTADVESVPDDPEAAQPVE